MAHEDGTCGALPLTARGSLMVPDWVLAMLGFVAPVMKVSFSPKLFEVRNFEDVIVN